MLAVYIVPCTDNLKHIITFTSSYLATLNNVMLNNTKKCHYNLYTSYFYLKCLNLSVTTATVILRRATQKICTTVIANTLLFNINDTFKYKSE